MKEILIKKEFFEQEVFKNEKLFFNLESLEEKEEKFKININLKWDNSEVYFKWRFFWKWKSKKNFDIQINSFWENQKIKIDFKWLLKWKAQAFLNWWVKILENSKNSEVDISQKVILLSKTAKIWLIPRLCSDTENISSASHSASVAPIDEEQFFYLWSRWIDRKTVENLILDWFLK